MGALKSQFEKDRITEEIHDLIKALHKKKVSPLQGKEQVIGKYEEIYRYGDYFYEDWVKRKQYLTGIASYQSNVWLTIMLGCVVGVIINVTNYMVSTSDSQFIFFVTQLLILLIGGFFAWLFSCADKNVHTAYSQFQEYGTSDFELELLDQLIKRENNHEFRISRIVNNANREERYVSDLSHEPPSNDVENIHIEDE